MNRNTSTSAAVETHGLGKRFGAQWALAHCDLVVEAGEAVLLAGANGSGKTTLLRLIAGLYKPTQGALSIFGHDPNHERLTCREHLTLVGHDHYLYSQLTALETVQVWSRLSGHHRTDEQLLELLEEVELRHRSHRRVGGFSAGMKKRLTMLRTRLEEPSLVLLDEPFSGLEEAGLPGVEGLGAGDDGSMGLKPGVVHREQRNRRQSAHHDRHHAFEVERVAHVGGARGDGVRRVEECVEGFIQEGKTVIVASHNLPRAARLCQRAVYLKDGQLIWRGQSAEMVQQMGLTS